MELQIVGCQFDIAWEQKQANYARVWKLLASGDVQPGSLVVLPEMFATGFTMNVSGIAEASDGESHAFLADLAAKLRSFVVGGIVTASPDGRGRNEAVVFDPAGQELTRYCKLHPFPLGGESECYAPGERPVVFECPPFQAAPFICYDLRFPEAFRHAVCAGAQLLIVIANWPQARQAHWTALLVARAIENLAYVVGVNRVGRDPKVSYAGGSMIIDPRGAILASADDTECVIAARAELKPLLDYRSKFPFLDDMRPEFFGA